MKKALLTAGETILRYAVWLALSFLGIIDVLLLRINLVDVLFRLRVSGWAIPAIEKWSFFVLGIAWLGVAIWLEDYLTRAKTAAIFRQRTVRTSLILGGAFLLTSALNVIL